MSATQGAFNTSNTVAGKTSLRVQAPCFHKSLAAHVATSLEHFQENLSCPQLVARSQFGRHLFGKRTVQHVT